MAIASARYRGLTMLEVVVVLAIFAVAGVFLVRVVSKLHGASNDMACRANMQNIGKAMFAYTLDHKGYFPYGYHYITFDPQTWQIPPTGQRGVYSWAHAINPYLGSESTELSPIVQCPLAAQTIPHKVGYVMNMIVGVSPRDELRAGQPPRAQTKPSKVELMRKEGTAILWDTAITQVYWNGLDSYLFSGDLDGQRFWLGANVPQYRYFLAHDPYGLIPPGVFGNNRPVRLFSSGMPTFRNIDPPPPFPGVIAWYPYQGNLRFRHAENTVCHALFSDGSVRSFTAILGSNDTVTSHDAIRRYFMTDWPPGVTPNPSYPH